MISKRDKISYFAWLLLGTFFVFSALTKGLDFFAVSAKIQDYARMFNVSVPKIFYGIGSISLVGAELLIGLLLIKGILRRFIFFCSLILLIFFLILTFYVALSDRFEDCGCFGSVLSATPWMSFVKNVFLLIVAIIAYPQSLHNTKFEYKDLIICVGLVIFLCCSSMFSQPLIDSSKYRSGKRIPINTDTATSIDVEFERDTVLHASSFGVCRHMDEKSVFEILQALNGKNTKPVILTSKIPRDIDSDIYRHAVVGFIDNNVLNNIIFTDFAIVTIDDNFLIVRKWQKDCFDIQFYNSYKRNCFSWERVLYMLAWFGNLMISIYYLAISIKRGCRKTHQRVGKINNFL